MSSFTKDLTITKIRIKKNKKFRLPFTEKYKWVDQWRVDKAFEYHVGGEDSDEIICVHAGFTTDGASIPRFLWPIIGHPFAEYAQAAVVHDLLYNKRGNYSKKQIYKRKRCDEIFYECMEVLEVFKPKRMAMYQGVRKFGWISWRKKEKNDK